MVYTSRGDFPEYPILVREMAAWLPAVFAPNEDVLSGELSGALDRLLALPQPEPPGLDGAEHAAARLLGLLGQAEGPGASRGRAEGDPA